MKQRIRSVLVASTMLLVAACAGPKAGTGMAAMNSKCPISSETLEGGGPTADFKGGKVEFCCEKCIGGWNKLSDSEKQAKLDKAK